MEPKVDSESKDGIEMAENISRIDYQISKEIEKCENDEINVSNDLQNEESFKTNKITFNYALIESIALKNTKIGPTASSKNIVYPICQTEKNIKENAKNRHPLIPRPPSPGQPRRRPAGGCVTRRLPGRHPRRRYR